MNLPQSHSLLNVILLKELCSHQHDFVLTLHLSTPPLFIRKSTFTRNTLWLGTCLTSVCGYSPKITKDRIPSKRRFLTLSKTLQGSLIRRRYTIQYTYLIRVLRLRYQTRNFIPLNGYTYERYEPNCLSSENRGVFFM